MPASSPSISAVICTHNRSRLLDKALERLRAVRVPDGVTWEVCVVDNNSTDDTAAVVSRHAAASPATPVRRLLEKSPGVAFARNKGVSDAAGEIIAFVDDDVEVSADWLTVIHDAFARDPDLAILGGRLDANPQSPPPPWLYGLNTAPLGLIDHGNERRVIDFPYLATGNCAFRKRAIVDAGMFDTRRGRRPDKLYADEDTEMVARIQGGGGKVVYDPAMLASHYVPDSRMTKAYFRRWYRERGEGVGLVGAEQRRQLFGIPFYEYRAALDSMVALCRNLILGRSTLQAQLQVTYFGGILAGRLKRAGPNPSPVRR